MDRNNDRVVTRAEWQGRDETVPPNAMFELQREKKRLDREIVSVAEPGERTIRFALWNTEETGLNGARAYAEQRAEWEEGRRLLQERIDWHLARRRREGGGVRPRHDHDPIDVPDEKQENLRDLTRGREDVRELHTRVARDQPHLGPFEVGQFEWPSDDGRMVVPAFTGGGLLVSATAKNLEAAKRFALGFQLDKNNLDNSAKADGLFPAIKGYTPPTDTGPAYKEGYQLFSEGAAANAVVPAFGFEAGDDGMIPGMVEKFDSATVDLITGKKSPDAVASFLDQEWEKSS